MARKLSGGGIIARMLAAEDVDTVFGIIDGTYYGLYASLPDVAIRLISPRHETSAAHMAGSYARVTGRLGVCIASNGPGVANVLPGVAAEQAEGNRVLLITSSRRHGITYPDRGGTYQYFDQVAVTRPMTRWAGHAATRDRIPELLRRALRAAYDGRPGVVHLDVPEDVINGVAEVDLDLGAPATYRRTGPLPPDPGAIEELAGRLAAADRPLIHAGSGVLHAGAEAELEAVAEQLHAAVTTSWGGRGVLRETSPHAVPMVHVDLVDRVRNEADVALVLGSRLGETDWWGRPPNWAPADRLPTVQVDLDAQVLGANRPVVQAIQADVGSTLRALRTALAAIDDGRRTAARRAWLTELVEARRRDRARLDEARRGTGEGVHPAVVPATAQEVLPDDTLWVLDGGNTAVWSHFHLELRQPRSILTTFKFGMLGAGMAQAIGAQVAAPDRPVCCLTGDGAFGMHPQEVETAVRHQLPVIYVVFADRQWGMVKMSQAIASRPVRTVARKLVGDRPPPDGSTIYADLAPIDHAALARSMGAHGERVGSADELAPALRRCLDAGRPSVVHVEVDAGAHLWAPGLRAFKKMHEEPS